MKKLIEITELKVGDVIVSNYSSTAYTIQDVKGNIYFASNKDDWGGWTLNEAKSGFKKQVEQERWRAKVDGKYEFIDHIGAVCLEIENGGPWDDNHFNLGNYFKPGEAQKHVEAFKEFFNKIKDE